MQAHPTPVQKKTLSQWMGCARYIWNAKTREEKEGRETLNTKETKNYPKINAAYAHLKSKEETPWLYDCPSVILRNTISNWRDTYQNFFKKRCGRPRHKKKDGRGSIYLTRELFRFEKCEDGVTRLFVGSKKHNLGHLSIKTHKKFKTPNSIYIKKRHNSYWVSFCYEAGSEPTLTDKEHYKALSKKGEAYLIKHTVGIDRGEREPYKLHSKKALFLTCKHTKRCVRSISKKGELTTKRNFPGNRREAIGVTRQRLSSQQGINL